jgi:subtilisin family serine protease
VDLDADGEVDDNERLRVLDATVVRGGSRDNDDGELQPRRDWVYIDANGNRERDVGRDGGFTEADPAYGEPLFVVDDADRDGELERPEKLVRLDSSKFRRVLVDDREFVRGEDLIEVGPPERGDPSYHGTAVASILAGGQPRFHDRVGLAPAADLVAYPNTAGSRNDFGEFGLTHKYIDDAIDSDVDILLHEWTDIMSTPQDGSTNLEQALDTARSAGIVQVNPLGNLNRSQKHVEQKVQAGGRVQLSLQIDAGYRTQGQTRPYRTFWSSLRWRKDQRPTFELTAPSGTSVEIDPDSGGRQSLGPHTVATEFQVSPRGTRQLLIVGWERQDSLAEGLWRLESSEVSKTDRFLGRVIDSHSGWNVGIRWNEPTRNRGTITFPATADSAFGVAAYGGRRAQSDNGAGSQVGELRTYSGRGPRIDGSRTADIVAPDDPVAALGVDPNLVERGFGRSWFRHFGGTSGAGPHVAASFALLGQLHPSEGPDQLETRLADAANPDDLTDDYGPAPNRAWGHGKLDVYEATSREEAPEFGERPVAELEIRTRDDQAECDASESSDPEGKRLEYRFDFEYDGAWDTDWRESATATTSAAELDVDSQYLARVAVQDPVGNRHGSVDTYRFESETSDDAGTGGDAGADTSSWGAGGEGPSRVPPRDGSCSGCTTSKSPNVPTWLAMGVALLILRRRQFT